MSSAIWGTLLLFLAGLFAASVSVFLHRQTDRLKFLAFFLAAIVFTIGEVCILISHILTTKASVQYTFYIAEWSGCVSLALVLSGLLLFVRESKPEFSRFPRLYAVIPLIIIASYGLVNHTVLLKNWLINIYQGGAVLVACCMYGIYLYRERQYAFCAAGAFLYMLTFTLYLADAAPLIWKISFFVSTLSLFSGFLRLEQHFD